MHEDLIDTIIFYNPDKEIQYRFVVSEFREKTYLSIREYYMDYNGEFQPTKNGLTFPYTLEITANLYSALQMLLSKAETLQEVETYVKSITESE